MPDSAEYSIAYIKLPSLDPLEALLFTGGSLFLMGCVLLVLTFTYEYFAEIRQRKHALILRDEMIRPPRCEQKCDEIGMNSGKDWRDYFARDDPFNE